MRRGWPALSESDVDGWAVRVSGGVTQRANSVLPLAAPADVDAALAEVESRYAAHGLPAVFQLGQVTHPPDLDSRLAARGYTHGSPTLVMTAPAGRVLARLPAPAAPVSVTGDPGDRWLDLWWQVDGRGDAAAREVARRILTGGPARYATTAGRPDTAAAVARLALVGEWGGLYCLAVHPAVRRRGLATTVTRALVVAAVAAGVTDCWLQVREDNEPARALYERAGFTVAARYHYRTAPAPA